MPKFKITTVTEEEIELPEYPFYVKKGTYSAKHISAELCIGVDKGGGRIWPPSISKGYPRNGDFCDLNYCSEQEFEENYNRVLKLITGGK